MAKARCRKCGNKKVSVPKVGTFVGDLKNFKKTSLGQKSTTETSQAKPDTPEQ
jgi:hypothetical protein